MEKVSVDRVALVELLSALMTNGTRVREMQATMNLPPELSIGSPNPIVVLTEQVNEQIAAYNEAVNARNQVEEETQAQIRDLSLYTKEVKFSDLSIGEYFTTRILVPMDPQYPKLCVCEKVSYQAGVELDSNRNNTMVVIDTSDEVHTVEGGHHG